MTTNRPIKVFLCHSSADKPAVRELYQKLRAEPWIQPWLDEEELFPGQDWEVEIEKAVEASDVVLVCLSNGSINKRGFVQKELRYALDVALEMPEETIFIVPLRLEECTPPRSLRDWQYADYFEGNRERAMQRLLVSLKRRSESLGLNMEELAPKIEPVIKKDTPNQEPAIKLKTSTPISSKKKSIIETSQSGFLPHPTHKWIEQNKLTLSNGMEFMRIPAGKFIMGSEKGYAKPQHVFDIPYDYWMARLPITNNQFFSVYKGEVERDDHTWKDWKNSPYSTEDWNNTKSYVKWFDNKFKSKWNEGLVARLPTEMEWEKAARGTDGREYPWGNEFDKHKCMEEYGREKPVGYYSPQGDSPYGCADMGNSNEWTNSFFKKYPGNNDSEDSYFYNSYNPYVVRGGGGKEQARCAYRSYQEIFEGFLNGMAGFRICLAPPLSK